MLCQSKGKTSQSRTVLYSLIEMMSVSNKLIFSLLEHNEWREASPRDYLTESKIANDGERVWSSAWRERLLSTDLQHWNGMVNQVGNLGKIHDPPPAPASFIALIW